ncbi:MAG: hypothetical protein IJJ99_01325 [Oscillospiraceae bacterium]|nr:hypothetical protein [Oscillospiraceae bacterium]
MSIQIDKFFRKNQIVPKEILYLVREEGKTAIYLTDGRSVQTFTPLKTVIEGLQGVRMLSVNKGVAVNEMQIVNVDNGCYTMTDGRAFRGRVRTPGEHSRNKTMINRRMSTPQTTEPLVSRFTIMDNFPLPFCIVELVFGRDGHGIDFLFRYCNKAMEDYEQIDRENLVNRTYYEVFPKGERKWLIAFSDIALHGGQKVIEDFKTGRGPVRVYCFQLEEGFCACALVSDKT